MSKTNIKGSSQISTNHTSINSIHMGTQESIPKLLKWLTNTFPSFLPNLQRVQSLQDLKSGVAVGQLLTEMLPETYSHQLLANIQVSNLSPEVSISNWTHILAVLTHYVTQEVSHKLPTDGLARKQYTRLLRLNQFTPEALHYRDRDLIIFIQEVIIKLWQLNQVNINDTHYNTANKKKERDTHFTYASTIMAHLLEDQSQEINKSKMKSNQSNSNGKNKMINSYQNSRKNSIGPNKSSQDTVQRKSSRQRNIVRQKMMIKNAQSCKKNTSYRCSYDKDTQTYQCSYNNSKKSGNNNNNINNINLSQLSDIANQSYQYIYEVNHINLKNSTKTQKINNMSNKSDFINGKKKHYYGSQEKDKAYNADSSYKIENRATKSYYQQRQEPQQEEIAQKNMKQPLIPPSHESLSQNLGAWLSNRLPSSLYISQPHQLLGNLVNVIFASSRLSSHNQIIKQAHFKHGPIFVYRKVIDFLLLDPIAQKVNKNNAMNMMKNIEDVGVVRQLEFWGLVQDLYIYDASGGRTKTQQTQNNLIFQQDEYEDQMRYQVQQFQPLTAEYEKQTKNKTENRIQSSKISAVSKNKKTIINQYTKVSNSRDSKERDMQNFGLNSKQSSKTLSKCRTSKQSLQTNINNPNLNKQKGNIFGYIYNNRQIRQIENWLQHQLGYSHTMSKIYSNMEEQVGGTKKSPIQLILSNPLLNATFASTILIRLKIGKPNINKYASSMEQIRINWAEINRCASLRGYQQFKKVSNVFLGFELQNLVSNIKELVSVLFGVFYQFRQEYFKKNPGKQSITSYNNAATNKQNKDSDFNHICKNKMNCNMCQRRHVVKQQKGDLTAEDKQSLIKWLQQKLSINVQTQSSLMLSVGQLTQICRELLPLSIYKQTTAKIQINNVEKILAELRRIGLSDYYHIKREQIMDLGEDRLRWKVLADIKWLIDGRIQFAH